VNDVLRPASLALVGAAGLVVLTVVAARATRLRLHRRRERLAEGPRRQLLAYLADGGPEDELTDLVRLPAPAWRAVEPAATALLAKVRGEARDALAALFERRGLGDRALAELGGRGAVRRARAAELLGGLGRRDAVPALCARLTDPDAEVRLAAIRALGHLGDPAATQPLLNTLATAEPAPVHLVAYALVQLDSGADARLLGGLDHPRAQVRATVLDTLRLRGTAGAESRAVSVLGHDADPQVRRRAAAMLGRVGGRGALQPLIRAAQADPVPAVREEAVRALGDLGHPAAVAALRALLDDPRYRVAHEAGAALVRLGTPGLAALREAAGAGGADGALGTAGGADGAVGGAAGGAAGGVAHGGRSAEHAREALAVAELTSPATVRSGT
jgi:HEAT repeat protein